MELLEKPPPKTNRRRRSLWKTAAYSGLGLLGTAILAGVLLFYFLPDIMINSFVKGRIEKEFAKAYPAYSVRIPSMQYNVQENRVGIDSLSLGTKDSTLLCTIARYSVSGIGWLELLWARGLVPSGFGGTVADAQGIVVTSVKDQYELRCGLLRVSVPDSEIVVEALELHPSGDDEQFFAGSRFRKTRFRLAIPRAKVTGLACLELLQGNMYRTRFVLIQDASLDVLINKDKFAARDTSSPPMPSEILSSIGETIRIDSLNISNAKLTYGERFAVGSKPAMLTFDSMQAVITGIANHGAAGDTIAIRAQGEFVRAGKMSVHMSIPLSPPEFSLRYFGSLSRMDLRKLNVWLETSDHMRIKSGVLQAATFDITVAAGRAGGNVRAVYRNLSIASLDPRTRSEEGVTELLTSFLANTFKIRGTNVSDKSGSMKIGVVKYVRKREDPFFGFIWVALRSGVGDVVGF